MPSRNWRHCFSLQAATTVDDGETEPTYSTLFSGIYGSLKYVGGSESQRGSGQESIVTHIIECDYQSIEPILAEQGARCRFVEGSKVYEVVHWGDRRDDGVDLQISVKQQLR